MKKIKGFNYPTFKDTWNDPKNWTKEEKKIMEFEAEIIDNLIHARETMGISQTELAEMSGMKQPMLAKIENKKAVPRIDTLFRALKPLGLTIGIMPIQQTN
ncbi:MAG: helix-turn-helix domain-containing protein [Endomicrobium sp.]|jgi:ribosome-binding protein aMBF1 (putative translation factor)|nr:helix-turn-helix domain-containing protein [Endomicrobium sp.]